MNSLFALLWQTHFPGILMKRKKKQKNLWASKNIKFKLFQEHVSTKQRSTDESLVSLSLSLNVFFFLSLFSSVSLSACIFLSFFLSFCLSLCLFALSLCFLSLFLSLSFSFSFSSSSLYSSLSLCHCLPVSVLGLFSFPIPCSVSSSLCCCLFSLSPFRFSLLAVQKPLTKHPTRDKHSDCDSKLAITITMTKFFSVRALINAARMQRLFSTFRKTKPSENTSI